MKTFYSQSKFINDLILNTVAECGLNDGDGYVIINGKIFHISGWNPHQPYS